MFKLKVLRSSAAIFVALAFFISTFPCPNTFAWEMLLPAPGVMVRLSPPIDPPILTGIKVHPDNPLRFDFILDQGNSSVIPAKGPHAGHAQVASGIQNKEQLKKEANRLIKYFLASLTIPEKDLWVNLSPYEKNRIIPNNFGLTEMGRDLLAEDYMLKQITASLIYPEDEIGKKFWKRIYQEAAKKFGTTNIPVNTFNKVWIVPEKAVVYENAKAGTAYIVESKLKVVLDQDYLSLSHHVIPAKAGIQNKNNINTLGSQVIREIVIPELTKEVNEGKNFAQLRQVYNSLILATWYKKKIKDSILVQFYADKKKIAGVGYVKSVILSAAKDLKAPLDSSPSAQNDTELIYQRYLQAFKRGVYNYIKEEQDPLTQQLIPRKYFSGGFDLAMSPVFKSTNQFDSAMSGKPNKAKLVVFGVTLSLALAGASIMGDFKARLIAANHRKNIIVQLRKQHNPDNINAFTDALKTDPSFNVQDTALESLHDFNGPQIDEKFIVALQNPNLRAKALRYLQNYHGPNEPEIIKFALKAFNDPSLGQIFAGFHDPAIWESLVYLDPVEVQETALKALVDRDKENPEITQALEKAVLQTQSKELEVIGIEGLAIRDKLKDETRDPQLQARIIQAVQETLPSADESLLQGISSYVSDQSKLDAIRNLLQLYEKGTVGLDQISNVLSDFSSTLTDNFDFHDVKDNILYGEEAETLYAIISYARYEQYYGMLDRKADFKTLIEMFLSKLGKLQGEAVLQKFNYVGIFRFISMLIFEGEIDKFFSSVPPEHRDDILKRFVEGIDSLPKDQFDQHVNELCKAFLRSPITGFETKNILINTFSSYVKKYSDGGENRKTGQYSRLIDVLDGVNRAMIGEVISDMMKRLFIRGVPITNELGEELSPNGEGALADYVPNEKELSEEQIKEDQRREKLLEQIIKQRALQEELIKKLNEFGLFYIDGKWEYIAAKNTQKDQWPQIGPVEKENPKKEKPKKMLPIRVMVPFVKDPLGNVLESIAVAKIGDRMQPILVKLYIDTDEEMRYYAREYVLGERIKIAKLIQEIKSGERPEIGEDTWKNKINEFNKSFTLAGLVPPEDVILTGDGKLIPDHEETIHSFDRNILLTAKEKITISQERGGAKLYDSVTFKPVTDLAMANIKRKRNIFSEYEVLKIRLLLLLANAMTFKSDGNNSEVDFQINDEIIAAQIKLMNFVTGQNRELQNMNGWKNVEDSFQRRKVVDDMRSVSYTTGHVNFDLSLEKLIIKLIDDNLLLNSYQWDDGHLILKYNLKAHDLFAKIRSRLAATISGSPAVLDRLQYVKDIADRFYATNTDTFTLSPTEKSSEDKLEQIIYSWLITTEMGQDKAIPEWMGYDGLARILSHGVFIIEKTDTGDQTYSFKMKSDAAMVGSLQELINRVGQLRTPTHYDFDTLNLVENQASADPNLRVNQKGLERIEVEKEELRKAAIELMNLLPIGSPWREHWLNAINIFVSEAVRDPGNIREGGVIQESYQLNYYLNQISSRAVILKLMLKAIRGGLTINVYEDLLNEIHTMQMIGRDEKTFYFGWNIYHVKGGLESEVELKPDKVLNGEYDLKIGYRNTTLPKSFSAFQDYFTLPAHPSRAELVSKVANYFYTTIKGTFGYPFGGNRVNNAVVMNIVNIMFRLKGYNGISHAQLDRYDGSNFGEFYNAFSEAFGAANPIINPAMINQKDGGIDLTSGNAKLQINGNGRIKFYTNAAMLAQLQNASGFIPIINYIQSLTDLGLFLNAPSE